MGIVQILVCEDEKLVANRLIRFINETVSGPIELVHVRTLKDAFSYLSAQTIDLLFLDLNLNGKDGFDILKQISSEPFQTIIVSAYADRAIEAFEYGVLDFIRKPFLKSRIKKAIGRYESNSVETSNFLRYVAINSHKGIEFIDTQEIIYIKADGIYSELFLKDGISKIYSKPMNQLLKLLPTNFIRVHKSYVVPLEHISGIVRRKENAYDVILNDNVKIPISRKMRKLIIEEYTV